MVKWNIGGNDGQDVLLFLHNISPFIPSDCCINFIPYHPCTLVPASRFIVVLFVLFLWPLLPWSVRQSEGDNWLELLLTDHLLLVNDLGIGFDCYDGYIDDANTAAGSGGICDGAGGALWWFGSCLVAAMEVVILGKNGEKGALSQKKSKATPVLMKFTTGKSDSSQGQTLDNHQTDLLFGFPMLSSLLPNSYI